MYRRLSGQWFGEPLNHSRYREGLEDYLVVCLQQWLAMDHSVAECWGPHPCHHLSPVKSRMSHPLTYQSLCWGQPGEMSTVWSSHPRQQTVSGEAMWQIHADRSSFPDTTVLQTPKCCWYGHNSLWNYISQTYVEATFQFKWIHRAKAK